MFPLQSVQPTPVAPLLPEPVQERDTNPIGNAFSTLLGQTLSAEASAHQLIETSLLGGDVTQAEVLAGVKKAELSIQMLMQIRNKVVESINEIQRMQF